MNFLTQVGWMTLKGTLKGVYVSTKWLLGIKIRPDKVEILEKKVEKLNHRMDILCHHINQNEHAYTVKNPCL